MKPNLPDWNLKRFYKGITDPKISEDFKAAETAAAHFAKKYRGKLKGANAPYLAKALAEYEKMIEMVMKPEIYGFLLFSMDHSKPEIGGFYQKIKAQTIQVSEKFIFFELELLRIPPQTMQKLLVSNQLVNYRRFLEKLSERRKHRLSEKEEKILTQKYLTSRSAFVRMYDQITAKKRYAFEYKGKKYNLLQTEILNLRMNPDRGLRKAAAEAFTNGLKDLSEHHVYIFNVLMQDTAITDKLLNFHTLTEARHLDNEISESAIKLMCGLVEKNSSIIRDYLKIKAKALRLTRLKFYDTLAPAFQKDEKISYAKMESLIHKSFENFHPRYAAVAKKFFEEGRIDAPIRKGKTGGAFCISPNPNIPSYILVNFDGKLHDVSVLAHELGHGINGELMRKQTLVNYDNPTILAEVASLFSELILFDYQLAKANNDFDKRALIAERIEDLAGNIFRGVSVYNFEHAAHKASRESGELTADQLNKLWIEKQGEMYKDAIDTDGGYENWWAYIGHFYHFSPAFYYYGYAFGALTALAMYAQYKASENKGAFLKKYFRFLSVGSSMSPTDRLKEFGFDVNDKEFWMTGLSAMKDLLRQFKKLNKAQ
jgi:oligoendopeptidase F